MRSATTVAIVRWLPTAISTVSSSTEPAKKAASPPVPSRGDGDAAGGDVAENGPR